LKKTGKRKSDDKKIRRGKRAKNKTLSRDHKSQLHHKNQAGGGFSKRDKGEGENKETPVTLE